LIGVAVALLLVGGAAQAQKTVCDSPCKMILLPLTIPNDLPVPNSNPLKDLQGKVGRANIVCDSSCKFLKLPLVLPPSTSRQMALPFKVDQVPFRDEPVILDRESYFRYLWPFVQMTTMPQPL
jgi:hypothetical protein